MFPRSFSLWCVVMLVGGMAQRRAMKRWIVGLAVVVALSWAPDAVAAALFWDDFNDGNADGWVFPYNSGSTQFPGGEWSVENGILVQHFFGDGNNGLVDNLILSDQVIETEARTIGYAGVVLWYQQVNDGWANYVAVSRNSILGLWVHELIDGHANTYIYGGPAIVDGAWYDLKVEADSATGSFAVSLDGAFVFNHVVGTSYRTGLSGLYSGNHYGYFDDFQISPIPEPSTGILCSLLTFTALALARCRVRRRTC